MTVETFRASVQYGDLKGTSSADGADIRDANDWLAKRGHKQPDELLLGIELSVGENYGVHRDPVHVHFLLVKFAGFDNVKSMLEATQGPIDLKRISEEMPIAEFLALFKRFSVCLSPDGLLSGRQFRY